MDAVYIIRKVEKGINSTKICISTMFDWFNKHAHRTHKAMTMHNSFRKIKIPAVISDELFNIKQYYINIFLYLIRKKKFSHLLH